MKLQGATRDALNVIPGNFIDFFFKQPLEILIDNFKDNLEVDFFDGDYSLLKSKKKRKNGKMYMTTGFRSDKNMGNVQKVKIYLAQVTMVIVFNKLIQLMKLSIDRVPKELRHKHKD